MTIFWKSNNSEEVEFDSRGERISVLKQSESVCFFFTKKMGKYLLVYYIIYYIIYSLYYLYELSKLSIYTWIYY